MDAVKGNAFLDFVDWAGIDWALRDSLQRNTDFVFEIDQFMFQNDAFFIAQLIKFSFIFIRLLVSPFGFLPAVEFGFERVVFGFEFGFEAFVFEWSVFSFVIITMFESPFGIFTGVIFAFERLVFGIEFSFKRFVFSIVLFVFGLVEVKFWFVITPLASVLLASAIVRPPLAFVGAGVEFFIAIFVFGIFGVFILTIEFIEVFGVGEVTSTEFGIGLTTQTAHQFARNLR